MRIGINVPNDLLKRMEPIKKIVNISQICRDAIQAWVDTYERAKERARQDGMEEVALRLSKGIKSYEVDWEALGHEDAKLWVQMASLEDFEHFAHNLNVGRGRGRTPGIWMAPYIPGTRLYGQRQQEHEEWFEKKCELDLDSNPYIQAKAEYERGWTSYLIAVWDMVRQGAEGKESDS
jgi:hypothetical protein